MIEGGYGPSNRRTPQRVEPRGSDLEKGKADIMKTNRASRHLAAYVRLFAVVLNRLKIRQVLGCASPLALSDRPQCFKKRQRTAAVQDSVASTHVLVRFMVPIRVQCWRLTLVINLFGASRYLVIIFAMALCPSMGVAHGDTWTNKTDMLTARQGLTTCVVNGKIYAIGGVNHPGVDTEVLRTVEAYDPATDSWAQKSDMLISRNWAACAVVNGKIYVIGGDRTYLATPRKSMEEYDPATDTWTQR